ncbi:P-loop containing nucleoside triphosphate hydrolase protein [Trematosphaeria pertusa]|uniref:P-loop containing nucleoside triphosphate hydrolase protein n=1 Tax=Trematosphaeria pertusa TaxID=390896 RepID=A0A6A6J1F0_9PLEO|nr:P-loop containing nucleoside triphosphate hydrolase protein [Trematosphaeria pertusa]KAF2256167.1 P-loop containing nucleoside triphosphate hydrolase protein [Trematosphaeria pertusa]
MPPFGGYGTGWKSRAKPTRDLCTIDLDEKTKADLISDIEHFWKEGRAQWYGDRGIPYRRGILMFGPPGTGKSSTCFAIAGKFAGALYSASMNEISDETQLKKLFSAPEKGDILLLEDIDSAGISREKMKKAPKSVVSAAPADGAKKSSRSKKKRKRKEKTSKISLAGLLGAIDTALNDGVVLIMTSNSPEALDKALIRPGRIDKQVLFGNISTAVAEHIFLRMYQDDASSPEAPNSRLARLATDFAFKIPDCKLTPAEVQGFLIPRVTPEEAVAEVEKWVEDMLAAKATGRNIVGSGGVRAAGEESEKDSGFGSEEEGDSGSEDSEGEGVDLEIEF